MSSTSFVPPLLLTVRFSTSLPDVDLDITAPRSTTVLSLKQLLRNRLDTRNRLRLIHQGRLLPDSAALSSVLKQPPPPPGVRDDDDDNADGAADAKGKGKGKAVVGAQPVRRIYVNCSIGDELSPEELAAEREAADKPPDEDAAAAAKGSWPAASTRPRPRGFDRLLQAGFTASEISTLRTQFASIHNERFAPDAMPSPDTLRSLEDAWIDSNAGELPAAGAAGGLDEDLESGFATVLDILVRGMMIGFFFPLGSMSWLLRQGIWSDKWQFFVGSGVVFSVVVGLVLSVTAER
jgi:hypothetical protein